MSHKQPHSADVLSDTRDHLWNQDFIELMAKRWNLGAVKSMLDVGCGIGHWSQMLAKFLPADAVITGIDPEVEWIEKAKERAAQKNLLIRTQYQIGSAEKIHYPDNHFDMVTCQTVLMHVKDPVVALNEMIRVLRPGGLLAVAEPSSLGIPLTNLNFDDAVDDITQRVRTSILFTRGRTALKEGNYSIAILLPDLFYQAGLTKIQIYLNDLAHYFVPPYETPREKIFLSGLDKNTDHLSKMKQAMQQLYLAGGGNQAEFEIAWEKIVDDHKTKNQAYNEKRLCSVGGNTMYLISGRKLL